MFLFSYCYFLFPGLPHFWPLFRFRVASFPGHFRLKLLITCSMQKRRGKGWEKESRAWHQVHVDMRGQCPIVVTHKPCIDQPQFYQIMSCIDTVFRTLQSQDFGQDIRRRISRFFIRYRPPRVYQMSCMWLFLPGLLPQFFHTAKAGGGNSLGTRIASMYYTEQERIRTGN